MLPNISRVENYDENKEINKRISRKNKNLLTLTRVKSPLNTKSKAEILFSSEDWERICVGSVPDVKRKSVDEDWALLFPFGCLFEVTNLPIEVLIAAFENLKAT